MMVAAEPSKFTDRPTVIPSAKLGRIVVIGGGIAGLASAYYLSRDGADVTLYESTDQLGGLGTFFRSEGRTFERFYHCILPSDRALLGLISELGIEDRVYWRASKFAFFKQGKFFGLNSPTDIFHFSSLSVIERFRFCLAGLYAKLSSPEGLDDLTVEQWLRGISGTRVFEEVFRPMLEAKFGDCYREIPALWFWTRFQREKGEHRGREVKGYIRGGYKFLVDTIVSHLWKQGVKIHLEAPVQSIRLDQNERPVLTISGREKIFDRLVYALPLPLLGALGRGSELNHYSDQLDRSFDVQGVVNVVLLLKRKLSDYYWVATVGQGLPFQGIVQTSQVIDEEDTGSYHLVYLMNYVHRSDPLFARDDESIKQEFIAALETLFPDLRQDEIAHAFVFKAPFVETIYRRGYLRAKPPAELVPGRFFLATTGQVYPQVTSWNGSTELAQLVSRRVVERAEAAPA